MKAQTSRLKRRVKPVHCMLLRGLQRALLILMLGVTMSACSLTTNWKEEVLLHDGSKIIVERSQSRSGRHEIGQGPPVKEHSLIFTLLGTSKPIVWKSEFSEDVGHSNFSLLALDIVNGTAYVVAYPAGCFAYNKWGRPNPPYVFFKYVDEQWKRIQLNEVPVEIKQPNLVIDTYGHGDVNESVKSGFISADRVKKINSAFKQSELRTILREPIKLKVEGSQVICAEYVFYRGSWIMPNDPIAKEILDRRQK